MRVRAVCSPCNNGWMNRIESDARPFLTALIEGSPIALDTDQLSSVARWIVMKSIVIEHASLDTAVTPRIDRAAFRANGAIPNYFKIYLGSHSGKRWAALYRDSRCITYNGTHYNPPLAGVPNNLQTITLYLGKVFAQVHTARVHGFEIEKGLTIPKLYGQRIWPLMHHEMIWPSEPIFTVAQVNEIANGLNAMLNANATGWLR